MDLFYHSDVKSILRNKFVVIIGDSIQRGIYKDLVLLLHTDSDRYLHEKELRDKGEFSFHQDELIEGGRKGEMTNGTSYTEVRQYVSDEHLIRFYFVTRCYNAYVESILSDLKQEPAPDIIMMNSCLWDMTRYGKASIVDYKENLITLCDRFKEVLPNDCLMLWNTTLPISNKARGGFLIPEIEFRTTTLRLDILEANYYARSVIVERGFDILDLHFYLRHHLDKRVKDGIHWDRMAHRYITNLLLSHICKAFDIPILNRGHAPFSSYLQQNHYLDTILPVENDLRIPEFESSPILRRSKSNNRHQVHNKGYDDDNWPKPLLPNHHRNRNQNPLGNFYSNWNDAFNNIMNSINPCLLTSSDGYGCFQNNQRCNIQQGWQNSWNSYTQNSNQDYNQEPYQMSSQGQCGESYWQNPWNTQQSYNYNGFVHNETFTSPIFPQGPYPSIGPSYFSQASLPYEQREYQGAHVHPRKKREKPYRRNKF